MTVAKRAVVCVICKKAFSTTSPSRNTCSEGCAKQRHKHKMKEWYNKHGRKYHATRRTSDDLPRFYRNPEPGIATCPYCGQKWNSPDKNYIKYHRACRTAALSGGYQAEIYGVLSLP